MLAAAGLDDARAPSIVVLCVALLGTSPEFSDDAHAAVLARRCGRWTLTLPVDAPPRVRAFSALRELARWWLVMREPSSRWTERDVLCVAYALALPRRLAQTSTDPWAHSWCVTRAEADARATASRHVLAYVEMA